MISLPRGAGAHIIDAFVDEAEAGQRRRGDSGTERRDVDTRTGMVDGELRDRAGRQPVRQFVCRTRPDAVGIRNRFVLERHRLLTPHVELEVLAGLAGDLIPQLRDRRIREEEHHQTVVDAVRVALDEREGQGGACHPVVAVLLPGAAEAESDVPCGTARDAKSALHGNEHIVVLHERDRDIGQLLHRIDRCVPVGILQSGEAAGRCGALNRQRALDLVHRRCGVIGSGEGAAGHRPGCGAADEVSGRQHRARHHGRRRFPGAGHGVSRQHRGRDDERGGDDEQCAECARRTNGATEVRDERTHGSSLIEMRAQSAGQSPGVSKTCSRAMRCSGGIMTPGVRRSVAPSGDTVR